VDWDGDGRPDILVGDREGNIHFFRRLEYGVVNLEEQDPVEVGGRPIDVGYNSAPCVTDWNADGLPDLVVGSLSAVPAAVFLFIDEGSPYSPVYVQTDTVLCQGAPIQLTAAYPDIHDLTGDGLEELLVGSANGNVLCCVNTGTPGNPVYGYSENLRADGGEIYFCSYVRPSICHWNDDGIPDLLLADDSGMVHLFTGVPPEGVPEYPAASVRLLRNPATGSVNLRVDLPEPSQVGTALFSLDGRLLGSVDSGMLPAGSNTVAVACGSLPAGLYVLRVTAGSRTEALRVAIIP